MDPKLVVVLMVGVIVVTVGTSEAITCYECDSTDKTNCADTFSSDGIGTCTNGKACGKTVYSFSGNTTTFVRRHCAGNTEVADGCYDQSLPGYISTVCICRTDHCNDGQMVKPTHYKILFAGAMSTLMAVTWMNQF